MEKLENFSRCLSVLKGANFANADNDEIYRTGIIGQFNLTFELAWKALQAVLRIHGAEGSSTGSPREILQIGYKVGTISCPSSIGDDVVLSTSTRGLIIIRGDGSSSTSIFAMNGNGGIQAVIESPNITLAGTSGWYKVFIENSILKAKRLEASMNLKITELSY